MAEARTERTDPHSIHANTSHMSTFMARCPEDVDLKLKGSEVIGHLRGSVIAADEYRKSKGRRDWLL